MDVSRSEKVRASALGDAMSAETHSTGAIDATGRDSRDPVVYGPPNYRNRLLFLAVAATLMALEPRWMWFVQLRGLNATTAFSVVALFRIAVVIAAVLLAKKMSISFRAMGFVRPAMGDLVGAIVLLAALLGITESHSPGFIERLAEYRVSDDLGRGYGGDVVCALVSFAIFLVFNPISEEVVYRSLMIGGLQPSPLRPVVVTCSCFAYGLTNIEFGSPTMGFVTGVVLSGMFLVRKSIWPAVIAIVSWNFFLLLGGMV